MVVLTMATKTTGRNTTKIHLEVSKSKPNEKMVSRQQCIGGVTGRRGPGSYISLFSSYISFLHFNAFLLLHFTSTFQCFSSYITLYTFHLRILKSFLLLSCYSLTTFCYISQFFCLLHSTTLFCLPHVATSFCIQH